MEKRGEQKNSAGLLSESFGLSKAHWDLPAMLGSVSRNRLCFGDFLRRGCLQSKF